MNIKGVNLNKKALKALRLMQSNDSELITLYLSAIDSCEDVLLTPSGIISKISDSKKLEVLALLRYMKKDLTTLINIDDEE